MTIEEIKLNPSLIMFEQDLPIEYKIEAIKSQPSILDVLIEKPIELRELAFSLGYYSDSTLEYISKYKEDSIFSFLDKASEKNLLRFSEDCNKLGFKLPEKANISVLTLNPELYASMEQTEDMNWELLKNTQYIDNNYPNPLIYIKDIKQEYVDFLYNKFGVAAFEGISGEWQTEAQKLEIVHRNPYDFANIDFSENIAKYYVENCDFLLPNIMVKNKNDFFYESRVFSILSTCADAIKYIQSPTEEMCLIAIQKNPLVIEYIENPSDTVCIAAINLDANAANLIKYKSRAVCKHLNIQYVKPSKYDKNKKYLIALMDNNSSYYTIKNGGDVDAYLATDCKNTNMKLKDIAIVSEINDDEIATLTKFNILNQPTTIL